MTNPFFAPSTLPYGLPPFADIADDDYRPAFDKGFEDHLAEITAIAENQDAPTFANTMIALESSGQVLERVANVFFNQSSADSNDFTIALEEDMAPLLAAHADAIRLNSKLYDRIKTLYEERADLGLDAESIHLIERYYLEFTVAGAGLDEKDKTTLRDYNQRLATLSAKFDKNLLADTNDLAVVVDTAEELDGLSAGEISAAGEAAKERGLHGKYLVTLVLPTGHPYLSSLTNRDLRERIMTASRQRGIRGGDFDNTQLVLDITKLRAERAVLLGFPNHAAVVTSDETAKTPEAVDDMLRKLAPAAARNAKAEQADLQGFIGKDFELASWDWALYSERVRKAKYDVDTSEMRPYFEAERVLHDGVFFAATKVYGITFEERKDLITYHPDVQVFEVFNEDGSKLGLFLCDLYTRDSKHGGAWMNSLISQNTLLDQPTVVVNNHNVPKPAAGEPTLLTYDEVGTLFHEFGHALHGLFGHVTYPKFSGTNVFRDFVEFPSQVNEMWMLWPEVLASYAVHHETGEPMPQDFVDKLQASSAFNEGFATSEYLTAALLDQAWHRIGPDADVTDVAKFEADAIASFGLDNPAVPSRYSSTYFAHTFSGGYDAGYYSYIWSEVLDADTVDWFKENGGMTRANGDRFREYILGIGGSRDPLEAFKEFRGRDAEIQPLLKRRGLD
jgi:peptidyl-dipeptidase Dcp